MKSSAALLFILLTSVCVACGGSVATSDTGDGQNGPNMDMMGGEDFVPPGSLDSGGDFSGELAPTTGAELSLVVHIDKPEAPFRNLLGVHKPARFSEKAPKTGTYDAWSLYQAFGIAQVRLHDSKLDVCHVYLDDNLLDLTQSPPAPLTDCKNEPEGQPPHVVWAVNDPGAIDAAANYDFENGVQPILDAVSRSGAVPYIRLGEGYNGPNDVAQPEAYAQVATNIFKYVIGQLANTEAGGGPHYVEVFNEPDGMFWVGSNENFYTLVRETIDRVNTAANELGKDVRVGSAGFVHGITENLDKPNNVAGGFIEAIGVDRLDFFSAHYYGSCVDEKMENPINWFNTLRQKLNDRGLENKPLHITEWNIGLGQQCGEAFFRDQQVQSFVSGMLTLMQDYYFNVEAAHFYSGIPNPMSLFVVDEENRFVVRPSAWAFWAHHFLVDGTILRSEICGTDSCSPAGTTTNFNIMGTGVRKGNTIFAVLTNITANDKELIVRFSGVSLEGATVKVYQPPASGDSASLIGSIDVGGVFEPDPEGITALMNAVSVEELALELVWTHGDLVVNLPGHTLMVLELTLPDGK